MNNLAYNQLLMGRMTLWSVDFSLDLGFKDICSLILDFISTFLQFLQFYVCH